jgi:hypothetical protein
MNEQTSPASLLDALIAKWRAEAAKIRTDDPSTYGTGRKMHKRMLNECAAELDALRPSLLIPPEKEKKNIMTYYGPHNCERCGATIVKASREEGGQSFDVPPLLLRVFQRGSEAGNPDVAYPMTWEPHVCGTTQSPRADAPPEAQIEA